MTDIVTVSKKLKIFRSNLAYIDQANPYYFELMRKFRVYLASVNDECLYKSFKETTNYFEYQKFFRYHNEIYMKEIEKQTAKSLIRNSENIEKTLLKDNHLNTRFSQKQVELQLLDFSSSKNAVIVGCGAIPDTAIWIAKNTNIKQIVGLDVDPNAILLAKQAIHILGLDQKIFLTHTDGSFYNYKGFDIIYIAGFVGEKKDILRQIALSGEHAGQILVDSPTGFCQLIHDKIPSELFRLKVRSKVNINTRYYTQEMIKLELKLS